jgi:hypothetical protein
MTNQDMPVFIYKEKEIHLTNKQCLGLELILNLSDEYRQFTKLGDKLYNSFIEREEYHKVTIDEFNWLKDNIRFII